MAATLPKQSGTDGQVTVDFQGNVAILTMDRGENRFNMNFMDAMHEALDKVLSVPDVQVLVTTGKGKFFSNGLDLNYLSHRATQSDRQDFLEEFHGRLFRLLIRLVEFPLVTVAALNGHAYAAGAFLALAHDYRVMNNERGWFCLNEVHIGLHISPYMQELISNRLPSGRVNSEVIMFGRRYTAEEASKDQIVEKICSKLDLVETAALFGKSMLPTKGFNRKMLQDMKRNTIGRKIRKFRNEQGLTKSNL